MSPRDPDKPCPDEAVLESLRTGESSETVAAHVAGCAACRRATELGCDLRGDLRLPEAIVPAEQDLALSSLFAEAAAGIRRQRTRKRLAIGGLAAAASLLLVVGVFRLQPEIGPSAPAAVELAATPVTGDFTRDGRLDVLDAFALARALESGLSPSEGWDLNGDGRVDGADVDALALSAVDLGRSS